MRNGPEHNAGAREAAEEGGQDGGHLVMEAPPHPRHSLRHQHSSHRQQQTRPSDRAYCHFIQTS